MGWGSELWCGGCGGIKLVRLQPGCSLCLMDVAGGACFCMQLGGGGSGLLRWRWIDGGR